MKYIATITFEVEIEAETKDSAEDKAEWYVCVDRDDVSTMGKTESSISVSVEEESEEA